jgi:prevent-host-death family protein
MAEVSVQEAKATLSRLLRRVADGEEIVISRADGEPLALLVPVRPSSRRQLGQDAGLFSVPGDFDDPLPQGLLDAFAQ